MRVYLSYSLKDRYGAKNKKRKWMEKLCQAIEKVGITLYTFLKKKCSSLVGSVIVIAAFALLGCSMMLPSISEKMELDEGLCVAEDRHEEYDYLYDSVVSWDPFTEMLDCLDGCDRRLENILSFFGSYCEKQSKGNEAAYEACYEAMRASAERVYLDMTNECVETLSSATTKNNFGGCKKI